MHPQLQRNNRGFIALLVGLQAILLVIYKFFFQITQYDEPSATATDAYNVLFYPMYQDVNVMMLIGFGFLMTFIKFGSWSALAYTFFINAIVVQYYLLWSSFWSKVFHGGWQNWTVYIREQNFTAASYSVASVLISFGAVLGRVGPYQLLLMGMVQIIAYTLNEYICYQLIHIYDAGGSTVIHTFGAYFGLAVSLVLALKKRPGPNANPASNHTSMTFAMIGTMFLWMFWPSFNAGYFADTPQLKSVIIMNTIISLTGSCIGAFITTSYFRQKMDMEDILNASLAGGVIIGAPSGLFTNPAASLVCGLAGGIISTLGFIYLSKYLNQKIGLLDTCGVNNLHGIPGILGGILSAIAIAAYQSTSLDTNLGNNLNFYSNTFLGRTYNIQAWWQILGLVSSLGIAIITGLITGFLMQCLYNFKNQHFYRDTAFFQTPQQELLRQPIGSTVVDPKSMELIKLHH